MDFVIENNTLVRYKGHEECPVIPDGVTRIAAEAFAYCTGIRSVIIPESVTVIGEHAFHWCLHLERVVIPDGVDHIGRQAFSSCGELKTLSIHARTLAYSLEGLGLSACPYERGSQIHYREDFSLIIRGPISQELRSELQLAKKEFNVYMMDVSCQAIPFYARKKALLTTACLRLAEEALKPEVLQSYERFMKAHRQDYLEEFAPQDAPIIAWMIDAALIDIDYIDGLIAQVAEAGMPELLNRLMAYQATRFGPEDYDRRTRRLFRQLERDAELRADPSAPVYIDRMWSVRRGAPNLVTGYRDAGEAVAFPERVRGVTITGTADSFSFKGETGALPPIVSVVLPEGYTQIGSGTFLDCDMLKSLTLAGRVSRIGANAFQGCTSLEEVHVPSLEAWLAMDRAQWEDNPMRYGADLFFGDACVNRVEVPTGRMRLPRSAFRACMGIAGVTILGGQREVPARCFDGCGALDEVTLPGDMTAIEAAAFRGCKSLRRMALPAVLTDIQSSAFEGCAALQGIAIPAGTRRIGSHAFGGCARLSEVSLPLGLEAIDDWAFNGCASLTRLVIPASVRHIGVGAFHGCSRLREIILPPGLVDIGYAAFRGCGAAEGLPIPPNAR